MEAINTIMQTINFKVMKDPLPRATAQNYHIDYLLQGPHIIANNKIIHSLGVTRDNLLTLFDKGTGGLRLYFCTEESGGQKYLSIILVPVDTGGCNVLEDGDGASAVINNLEPCPDKCSCKKSYDDSVSKNDLNFKIVTDTAGNQREAWCKPNRQHLGPTRWFAEDGTPIMVQP